MNHSCRTRTVVGLVALALVGALASEAAAAPRRHHRRHHRHARAVVYSDSSPPGTFGLGLILGGPTGLSGKLFLSDSFAFDFAIGYYRGFGHDEGGGGHADLLWHPFSLGNFGVFSLPLYFGVGGRVAADRDQGRFDTDNGVDVGVRVPLGIAFEFNAVPLDVFLEAALIADVIDDDDDNLHVDLAGGIRFWF